MTIIYCKCGCGQEVNPGNKFILGHNSRVMSKKTRAKLSRSRLGKPLSLEARIKVSLAMKTRWAKFPRPVVSKETREKLSQYRGPKAPRYTGAFEATGLHSFMTLYEFRDLKNLVRARDKKCIKCMKADKKRKLDIHHVVPIRVGLKSKLCDHESNLVAVCIGCHRKIEPNNKEKDGWKDFLPEARNYLEQFGYKKMLLNRYLH